MKHTIFTFIVLLFLIDFTFAQSVDSVASESTIDENYETPTYEETPHTTVEPRDLNSTREYTSGNVKVKKFDDWKNVTRDKDYDNVKSKPKNRNEDNQSGNGEGKRKEEDDEENEALQSDPSSPLDLGLNGTAIQVIFYTLIALIIGAILFMILKNASWKSNPKIEKSLNDQSDATNVEDIATLDLDDLLKQSQAAGNYRLALRINFLSLLKRLNEIGFIRWKKDKTNREYLNELLAKQRFFDEVRTLTLAYEQVWYGDHDLPADAYERLMVEFKALDVKLNMSKAL